MIENKSLEYSNPTLQIIGDGLKKGPNIYALFNSGDEYQQGKINDLYAKAKPRGIKVVAAAMLGY